MKFDLNDEPYIERDNGASCRADRLAALLRVERLARYHGRAGWCLSRPIEIMRARGTAVAVGCTLDEVENAMQRGWNAAGDQS